MTKRRFAATVAGSAMIACVAIIAVHRVAYTPTGAVKMATRPLVIALHDIDEGRPIDSASVAVVQWPLGTVPLGAYGSIDRVVGRVATRAIFKGEVIVPRLATDTTRRGPQ